jgi:eukaryotic translation initiation factor 2C
MQVENAVQKSLATSGTGARGLGLDAGFPSRPGYGTRGQKVVLWANYFELIPKPGLNLYRYDVRVVPTAAGRKLTQIVRLLLDLPAYQNFRKDIVTDFKANLISRVRLQTERQEYDIPYKAEGEDDPLDRAARYKVYVEETGTFTVTQLVDYLNSTNTSAIYSDKLDVIQALNIFLRHYANNSTTLATVGKSKTFPLDQGANPFSLGAGLTAVRGFFSSVRVAACRILVNVNVSHGAFYDAGPLTQMMTRFSKVHGPNEHKLENFVKKLRVKTTHLKEKKNKAGELVIRVKVISGLANKNDGHGSEHPPLVAKNGAGPAKVQFWLNDTTEGATAADKTKGKGKPTKPSTSIAGGKYITVAEFFRTCM